MKIYSSCNDCGLLFNKNLMNINQFNHKVCMDCFIKALDGN